MAQAFNSALGKQREVDFSEFKACLVFRLSSYVEKPCLKKLNRIKISKFRSENYVVIKYNVHHI